MLKKRKRKYYKEIKKKEKTTKVCQIHGIKNSEANKPYLLHPVFYKFLPFAHLVCLRH